MPPSLFADPIVWTVGWVLLNSSWLAIAVWVIHRMLQRLLRTYGPSSRYWAACSCLIALVGSCLIMGALVWSNRPISEWVVAPRQLIRSGYYTLPTAQPYEWLSGVLTVVRPALVFVAGFWTFGLMVVSLLILAGWIRLKRSVRSSFPIPNETLPTYESLCDSLTPGRQPKLLLNDLVEEPATAGWRSPVILIPDTIFNTLDAEQLHCVLAHELAHIRRSDYFVNLLQTACDSVLFFHPCARWLSSDVRQLREECCDDIAAVASGGVRKYGEALLALVNVTGSRGLLQRATGGSLYDRIDRLIRMNKKVRRDSPLRVLIGMAATCVILVATVATLGDVTQYARIHAAVSHHPVGDVLAADFGLKTPSPNVDLVPTMTRYLQQCEDEQIATRDQLADLVAVLSKGAVGNELLLSYVQEIAARPKSDEQGVLGPFPYVMLRWSEVYERMWQLAAKMPDPKERHTWGRAALALACQQSFSPPRLQAMFCDPAAEDILGASRADVDRACRIVADASNRDHSALSIGKTITALRLRKDVRFADIAHSPNLVFVYLTQTMDSRQTQRELAEIAPFTQDEVTAVLYRLVIAERVRHIQVHDPSPVIKLYIAPKGAAPGELPRLEKPRRN